MCGIFGIILGKNSSVSPTTLQSYTKDLFILSESRGKEASGMAIVKKNVVTINKQPVSATEFIRHRDFKSSFESTPETLIGHSRLVTNGHQENNANNQPTISKTTVLIHNGIIVNDKEITKKFPQVSINSDLDTQVACNLINFYSVSGHSQIQAIQKAYREIKGSASMAILTNNSTDLALATNTGSIFVANYSNPKIKVFASEKYILEKFTQNNNLETNLNSINQVKSGQGIAINYLNLKTKKFVLKTKSQIKTEKKVGTETYSIVDKSNQMKFEAKKVSYVSEIDNKIHLLQKHVPQFESIKKIKRCTKCILPKTMPFIYFDENGICNFCKLHTPPSHKGKAALQKHVDRFRKRDKPDCIVALSGGRDSSYGLHYVKNVLKMNPIAYTYDWGMITDTARRNQARLVGAMGVEHIIVSADIKKKRQDIKHHLMAWLKKPDLGMVPLFTAGDKQAEYYIEKLKKQTGIKLVIYCRGNELEDERFKFGHLGIFDGTPGGVIHDISVTDKIKISLYYLKQYLTNPNYINSSLWDTLFAYLSVYLMKHDFVYLWHYIPWNEKRIVSTLKNEYGWETAKDTVATWRIDDGTPAFYNYIYYTIQGFTEHDALRSNQIREGITTRSQALKIVEKENGIRYQSLKWYFDAINVDGNKVLNIIDKIPKLYTL